MSDQTTPSQIINEIKQQALEYPKGILRPGQSFDSYIGHTVINLSNVDLSHDQVQALEKRANLLPYPR